eukprot:CAMPEP_0184714086 /NCGR_PEP_ID=MMETSP0314-20130426/4306_1 /TAXON_ID=38298 /ORGANISM="Rhodella maculata, Strain CCMP 736" /LENGTH=347 /DNA_ID=CAMNT_0027176905 /DNA_START=14 /DNA_END=1057 /DNA_ORIENTATION=+
MTTPSTYVPKCILITGAAGFIGSFTAALLAREHPEYRIIVLDKLDYCSSRANLDAAEKHSNKNFKFIHGNILSRDLVSYILEEEEVDTIMNFAASTHVDNSFSSSIVFTENNVLGTHVLLECSRVYGKIRRFIHVSTDEVYGGESLADQPESATMEPTNPYACTKAAAELICKAYIRSFNIPIIISRGNNVYGPHQFPDKLIPKTVCLINANSPAFIHGDGSHTRNFLFVEDAATAFSTILHAGTIGEVYNIGSPIEKSNIDVVRDIIRLCDRAADEATLIEYVRDRSFNDQRYLVDSKKLHDLGWHPSVSWEDGLRKCIEWYSDRSNLERWPRYTSGLVAHPTLVE